MPLMRERRREEPPGAGDRGAESARLSHWLLGLDPRSPAEGAGGTMCLQLSSTAGRPSKSQSLASGDFGRLRLRSLWKAESGKLKVVYNIWCFIFHLAGACRQLAVTCSCLNCD